MLYTVLGLGFAMLVLGGCAQASSASNTTQNGQQSTTPTGTQSVVTTGTVQTTIVATGKVVARDLADIAFQRSGQIISVTVQEGQTVKKGQPLAYLDQSGLSLALQNQYDNYISALAAYSQTVKGPSAADVASAKAAIASAQASYGDLFKPPSDTSLANLKATLDNAKAALDQAQANYDRAYKKNPAGIGGAPEGLALQQATNNYIAAKANYDNAFAAASNGSVAGASANIASAKAKLDALYPVTETVMQAQAKVDQALISYEQAQQDISNTVIYAPYDGMVTQVPFNVGDFVGSGQMAVEVADVSNPWFEVNVDEADIGSVRVGQTAVIQLQAYPNVPVSATVESIASSGTSSASSVTFLVKLALGDIMTNNPLARAGGQFGQRGQRQGQGQGTGTGQGTGQGRGQGGQGGQNGQGTQGAQGAQGTQGAQGQTAQTGGQGARQFTRPIVRLGMSGTGQVITAKVSNAVVVPSTALVTDRTTRSFIVYKVNGSTTQSVPVTVGLRDTNGSTVQIVNGLNPGDTILIPHATTNNGNNGGGGRGPFGFFGG